VGIIETKPAFYTTEFWTTLFVNVINLINLTGLWNFVPNKYSVLAMAIVQGLYTASRGIAKNATSFDPNNGANYKLIPRKSDLSVHHR